MEREILFKAKSQIVFGDYSLNQGWCSKGVIKVSSYCSRLFDVGFGPDDAKKCEVIGNVFDDLEGLSK